MDISFANITGVLLCGGLAFLFWVAVGKIVISWLPKKHSKDSWMIDD